MGPGLLALAPAVIGAAGSAASSIIGGSAASSATRETNATNLALGRETNEQNYKIFQESKDFSREQADTQWEREKEMFNMENSYNNPVNVVGRLREAGINPALAMQGSLGSAMSSAASGGQPQMGATPSAPTMVAPQMQSPAPYYQNIATGVSDAMFKASQIAKNFAEAKKTGVDTERLEKSLQSYLDEQEATAKIQKLNAYLLEKYGEQKHSGEVSKLFKEIDNVTLSGDLLNAQYRLTHLEGNIKATEDKMLDEKYKRVKEYIDAELEQMKQNYLKTQAERLAIPQQVRAQMLSAIASGKQADAAMLNAQTQKWIAEHPNELTSFFIKGLALNGLGPKEVVKAIGQTFGFLPDDERPHIDEQKVIQTLKSSGLMDDNGLPIMPK